MRTIRGYGTAYGEQNPTNQTVAMYEGNALDVMPYW